jgi:hypothetical protein
VSRSRRDARRAWIIVVVALTLVVAAGVALYRTAVGERLAGRNSCTATAAGGSGHLSAEQTRYATLIAARSIKHDLPPRAATIALATALQESDLENLDHGHADSVGLFQQRPSMGWGSQEQLQDPSYATDKFYAALARIAGYTTMSITDAAQRVQISARGDAYAQHEARSRSLASALTGETPAAFTCTRMTDVGNWTTAEVAKQLTDAFGLPATAVGDRVTVKIVSRPGPATSAAAARWAVAAWAIGNTAQAPITSVSTSGRTWTVKDGWQADTLAPDSAVIITLGSG